MCLYTKMIINPKYKKNKKNGGQVPLVPDERIRYIPVGCGNCIECRKQEKRKWQVRLLEEIKENKNGKFIGLTFSNESIKKIHGEHIIKYNTEGLKVKIPIKEIEDPYEMDNEIATWAMRHFLENWRKEFGTSIRHWFITELGHKGTENIHLHGLVWTDETIETIRRKWPYGYMWPKPGNKNKTWVNGQTVNYMVKYVNKMDKDHPNYKPKILTSSGIGNRYTKTTEAKMNIYKGEQTQETYRTETGHKIALPIYYRNKIYKDWEREMLWIQRLNKEERWIRGERIDISQGEEEYYKALKWHRRVNTELGYGSDKKNKEQEYYEKERRHIIIKKRIENAK